MESYRVNCKGDRYNDPHRITITEAAHRFYDVVREVQATGARKLLTKHGRVVASIVPLEEIAIVDEVRCFSDFVV